MNNYEQFLLDLHHAKLKCLAIKDGDVAAVWDNNTQNKINALPRLESSEIDIEAYVIASVAHFKEKRSLNEIIKKLTECFAENGGNISPGELSFALFNRLNTG